MTTSPSRELTQRELLGLVLEGAAEGSADFSVARRAAEAALDGDGDPRPLARELLTDLTIRSWIYLVREEPGGELAAVPRSRYEMELAAERNWDERGAGPRTRYALTEKGRAKLVPLLGSLRAAPRDDFRARAA